jgi:hypothetical protein
MGPQNGLAAEVPRDFDPLPSSSPHHHGPLGSPCIYPLPDAAVLKSSLPVVISLRQTLPVTRVPEQLHVSLMRDDVIHNDSSKQPAVMITKPIHCDRMRPKPRFRSLLPA